MAADDSRSLHATCEDYHSDDSDIESMRRSPNQANVTAKRSHHSDLGTEKAPAVDKVVNIDQQSDSGYSSHTAATMSSADSAPSVTSRSPAVAPVAAPEPPTSPVSRRRPTLSSEGRRNSVVDNSRKPLKRTDSTTRRHKERRPTVTSDECRDPTCTKCVAKSLRGPSLRDSALDVSYAASDQQSRRSDPASSYRESPPSPTYSRQLASYAQGSALVQPAQTRPRRSSSTTKTRPISYQGDPGHSYWAPGMPAAYPSPPQEHGPPPSMSAYHHPQLHSHPQMYSQMMSGTPPGGGFYGMHHGMPQTSPPYGPQGPPLSARGSSFQARRPLSGNFGAAQITYDHQAHQSHQNLPSARYGVPAPKQIQQSSFDDSGSEESDGSEEEEDRRARNARALMPPPSLQPATSTKTQRPILKHAKTTQVTHVHQLDGRLSQSQTLPERPRHRDIRDSGASRTSAPSRAPSKSRPALVQQHKARSYETSGNRQIVVEDARSHRRQSYQEPRVHSKHYDFEEPPRPTSKVYEKNYETERPRRSSKVYRGQYEVDEPPRRSSKIYHEVDHDEYDPEYDDGGVAVAKHVPLRRQRAATESRRRDDDVIEAPKDRRAVNDAEAYQRIIRGSNDPHSERVHRAAKKALRDPSGPSDAGSSRSKGSGKESRISQSARTTTTNGGNGEIRLRVDASAPLSLQFNGDMEGRTLQINPAEDGMADIVIGNSARGNESVYRSEKGSVYGSNSSKKSVLANQARRDFEEASVRSSRTSHIRRDKDRRALRHQEIVYR